MMRLHYLGKETVTEQSCAATIGFFDGVHLGHRYLLRRLVEEAREAGLLSCVITFDKHPRQVLQSSYRPSMLTTFEEKQQMLSQTGIDLCVVLPFSQEMASLTAKAFMKDVLQEAIHVKKLYIGYDHRFGHNRSEGFDDYVRYGQEMGMEVVRSDAFHLRGMQEEDASGCSVSSSRIRSFLLEGDADQAKRLLGYPYTLSGRVVSGMHEGRKLGFPTANLDLENMEKLIPAPGVYAVTVRVDDEEDEHLGMMNIGTRPTFGENRQTLEVHVLDYSGDLYHHTLSVSFHHRLREEHRFASAEELRSQLLSDAQEVKEFFTTK